MGESDLTPLALNCCLLEFKCPILLFITLHLWKQREKNTFNLNTGVKNSSGTASQVIEGGGGPAQTHTEVICAAHTCHSATDRACSAAEVNVLTTPHL